MKRKNLERTIVAGLLAGCMVLPSAVWAGEISIDYISGVGDFTHNNKQFNNPDDDIVINWEKDIKIERGQEAPVYGKADITAKSITITNKVQDEMKGKGLYAYNESITITAKKITIDTFDDGVFRRCDRLA